MKLLDKTADTYPSDILKNTVIIGCQHLLPTIIPLIQKVMDKGVKEISLIGKCYSADKETINTLREIENVRVEDPVGYNSHSEYRDVFEEYIQKFLAQELERLESTDCTDMNLIILDIGALIIDEMNTIYNTHSPKWKLIAGVEQSMSGYNIITSQPMNFPIVDVATSNWKRTHEASFIARDCVNILLNRLKYKHNEDIYQLNY